MLKMKNRLIVKMNVYFFCKQLINNRLLNIYYNNNDSNY